MRRAVRSMMVAASISLPATQGASVAPTLDVRSLPQPIQLSAKDRLTPQTLLQIQRTNQQLAELAAYYDQRHRTPIPVP
jgi:hypothetical protein